MRFIHLLYHTIGSIAISITCPPPPTPIPQPTVVKPVVEQKIAEFHRQFFQAFGSQFPEFIIGPYVYKKFLGRTHAVYYLEGGQNSVNPKYRDGHYQQMIDKMTELRSQYPEGILPYDNLESEEYIKNKDRNFVIHFRPLQEITIPNYDINDMQMNLLIFLDE